MSLLCCCIKYSFKPVKQNPSNIFQVTNEDVNSPDWIRIDEDENTIYGLSLAPSVYIFNVLLFGAVFGNYVNLCHSVEYEFKSIHSSTSMSSFLESETMVSCNNNNNNNNNNNERNREVEVLTLSLPFPRKKNLLDFGEFLSKQLELPLNFLQILPENSDHNLYKQLHSLNVVASSARVLPSSVPIENEVTFSWLIPCNQNTFTLLNVLANPPRQHHSRKRRDTRQWDWHIVRGRFRVRRELFFSTISAVVGTPTETTLDATLTVLYSTPTQQHISTSAQSTKDLSTILLHSHYSTKSFQISSGALPFHRSSSHSTLITSPMSTLVNVSPLISGTTRSIFTQLDHLLTTNVLYSTMDQSSFPQPSSSTLSTVDSSTFNTSLISSVPYSFSIFSGIRKSSFLEASNSSIHSSSYDVSNTFYRTEMSLTQFRTTVTDLTSIESTDFTSSATYNLIQSSEFPISSSYYPLNNSFLSSIESSINVPSSTFNLATSQTYIIFFNRSDKIHPTMPTSFTTLSHQSMFITTDPGFVTSNQFRPSVVSIQSPIQTDLSSNALYSTNFTSATSLLTAVTEPTISPFQHSESLTSASSTNNFVLSTSRSSLFSSITNNKISPSRFSTIFNMFSPINSSVLISPNTTKIQTSMNLSPSTQQSHPHTTIFSSTIEVTSLSTEPKPTLLQSSTMWNTSDQITSSIFETPTPTSTQVELTSLFYSEFMSTTERYIFTTSSYFSSFSPQSPSETLDIANTSLLLAFTSITSSDVLPSITSSEISSSITSSDISSSITSSDVLPSITYLSRTSTTSTEQLIPSHQSSFTLAPLSAIQTTTSSSSQMPTNRPDPNSSPVVINIIETLFFGAGKFTIYQIPRNIFMDKEDGDTRNLTLVCFTGDEKNNLSITWINFNSSTQTLNALPLSYDYEKQVGPLLLHLRAYDNSGLYTTTQFQIAINSPLNALSYFVSIKLLINFDEFISSRTSRYELASRIGEFYGESSANSSIYFHSVRNGSTILYFNNLTLATTNVCDKQAIQSNVDVIKSPNTNEAQKSFKDFLSPQFPIVDMNVQYSGVCSLQPTNAPSTGGEDKKYLEYLIPIIVLSMILIIVVIIVCIVFRKQRNKRTFYVGSRRYEKGQPVVFPDELELQAPPKMRLNQDLVQGAYLGPYDNTSFDSPDFRGRAEASKPPVNISSDDDSSLYSYFKTPSGSPPEYNEPPPYSLPFGMDSSEI